MIELYWLSWIIGGSFIIGMLFGAFWIFYWHHKKTGKWIYEEAKK